MVVKTEPIPFMKHAYHYGARSAREEALLKGLDASARQAEMNKAHTGGAMTVPQIYTGSSGDATMNEHLVSLSKALTQHQANSEFDELATKKGGRKRKSKKSDKKTKKSKKSKKNIKKSRKTRN